MERKPVDSSMLISVGYDPTEQLLELEFAGGRVYQYLEVPATEHRGLMGAESKGSYFNENIRDCYRYLPVSQSRRRAA
jgi:hypothetical protein